MPVANRGSMNCEGYVPASSSPRQLSVLSLQFSCSHVPVSMAGRTAQSSLSAAIVRVRPLGDSDQV